MEAARTLHIPEAQRGRVEVRDGVVAIELLELEDATLVELIERRLEHGITAQATVTDAIEIGARVLDREAIRAEVDFVKREFEQASTHVETAFVEQARKVSEQLEQRLEQFLGEDSGTMTKALDAHADDLNELIASNFGGDRATAVQHQLHELMTKLLNESRQDLLRQFSAEDGHNPLADFKGSIIREAKANRGTIETMAEQMANLRLEVQRLHDGNEATEQLALERERGTSKGRDFEQRVFDLLEQLAVDRGDVAHHVGDERSASGGKRGDIVVEIEAASGPAKGRIVFDAKDEQLSKNAAWKTLDASLVERDGQFAVLVVATDEKVPSGRQQLHEYEGNKMIVALDKDASDHRALKLAFCAARMRVLMAQEKQLEVDAPGVRDAAHEALSALKDAQKIRASLTGATKGVDGARAALDEMIGRVEVALERVESLITAG